MSKQYEEGLYRRRRVEGPYSELYGPHTTYEHIRDLAAERAVAAWEKIEKFLASLVGQWIKPDIESGIVSIRRHADWLARAGQPEDCALWQIIAKAIKEKEAADAAVP